MHPAVPLGVAAVCLAGSVYCYRHRDGVLRIMTRVRGHAPDTRVRTGAGTHPPGPRRRYQRGAAATLDMLWPALALLVLAWIFAVSGVLAWR